MNTTARGYVISVLFIPIVQVVRSMIFEYSVNFFKLLVFIDSFFTSRSVTLFYYSYSS